MINSMGSSVVVGGEGSQGGLVGAFVVPDGGGEREESLQHAGGDAVVGSSAVTFEIELAFEGVVDRLDDLTEWFEQADAGPWWFVLERGTQQPHAMFAKEGLELAAGVSLVGDHGLACSTGEQFGFDFEQVAGDFAFV